MKTSVVLSAYNGEKYILEQLESIRMQTIPVDEVLIVDDCSTDNTVTICRQYIKEQSLTNWSFVVNSHNKGFIKNFLDGFNAATGEVIFVCDQDDRWKPNKVEQTMQLFEQYSNALLVCSGFSRFGEGKVYSSHVKVPHRKRNGIKQVDFDEFCKFHAYLGMTMAFKKSLLMNHYSDCINYLPYDISLAFLAVIEKGLYYVDEVLVDRRSYSTSTSNKIASDWVEKEFKGNKFLYGLYRVIGNLKGFHDYIIRFCPNSEYKKIVESYIRVDEIRYHYYKSKSFMQWTKSYSKVTRLFTFSRYIKDGIIILKEKLQ